MERVRRESQQARSRAYFACSLALAWPDGDLVRRRRPHAMAASPFRRSAHRGFGHDPIFVPEAIA